MIFKARYAPEECQDLPYQCLFLWEKSLNEDKYERGGWYATEQEAIEGAKRGYANYLMLEKLFSEN